MNVYQRQMFANGDEVVNVDRLIQYYTAQGYNPVQVTEFVKGEFPAIETATVLDKMREYKELFPEDAQRMPPAEISQEVRADLEPNQIQYQDGSRQDFSVAINRIKNDDIRLENVFALYNTPGVSLGSNVKSAVEDYIRRKQPEILQTRDEFGNPIPIQDLRGRGIQSLDEYSAIDAINVPTSYQFLGRQLLGAIKEGGREGLETLGDLVGGEDVGDLFRGDFMDGDPDMFMRSGGRDINAVTEMAKAMNNPDQIRTRTGFIGDAAVDTISDLFGSIDMSTPNLDTFVDQTREKTGLDPIDRDLQNINDEPVSNEAKDAGQPVVKNQEVPVTVVEENSGDDDGKADEKVETPGTGEAAEPDITDGEATKRNFGEFIQSPDFIRFARNLGKGLATTGQIGQGIALGAAGAAEEKEAERQAEREAEIAMATKEGGFNRFLAEQRVKNTAPDKIAEQTTKLSEAINDIEQGEISMQMFNSVKEIMSESEITGLGAITNSLLAQAKGFLPGGSQEPTTPRERAIVILEQIANGNIKTITGESGRTISNVDRQIAEKLVGSLKNPLTRETEVLERIEAQIRSVTQRTNTARNKYDAIGLYFTSNGLPIPLRPRSYGVPTTEVSAANPYPNTTFIDATKK